MEPQGDGGVPAAPRSVAATAGGGGCAPRLALALVWRGRAPFDWNDRGRGDPERVRAAMDD